MGYADALSRPADAPYTHPEPLAPADALDDGAASDPGGAGFRLPAVGDDAEIPGHAPRQVDTGSGNGSVWFGDLMRDARRNPRREMASRARRTGGSIQHHGSGANSSGSGCWT